MGRPTFEQYWHHGRDVWVRTDYKGKHKEFCLCYKCKHFVPEDDEDRPNCHIANQVYSLCVKENLVLPVWECPGWEPKGDAKPRLTVQV